MTARTPNGDSAYRDRLDAHALKQGSGYTRGTAPHLDLIVQLQTTITDLRYRNYLLQQKLARRDNRIQRLNVLLRQTMLRKPGR